MSDADEVDAPEAPIAPEASAVFWFQRFSTWAPSAIPPLMTIAPVKAATDVTRPFLPPNLPGLA